MPRKRIESVLDEHTGRLLALGGVVGVAIGEYKGKSCINVYVVKMTPKLRQRIPSTLEGYTVRFKESGEFRALGL